MEDRVSNDCGKDFILTDYARRLIEFKAKQLSRQRGFQKSDEECLEQELWLAVTQQADRFDPSRASLDTFLDRVIGTSVAMIVRDRHRLKRRPASEGTSLDAPADESENSESMAAQVSYGDLSRRTGVESEDEHLIELRQKRVQEVLDQMPPEISDVCRRVMGGSVASAARELKTSRRQIQNALQAAAPYFERADLDD
jgi:hypothetical protein